MDSFNLEKYFARTALSSAPPTTEVGLRSIHRAQAFTIPFENIDPFLCQPVSLVPNELFSKLVERGRGGYCFELNGLFSQALGALGFKVRPVLGRVFMGRETGGSRTHLAHLVEIKGRTWLADVGFGGPGLIDPIPFEDGYEEEQCSRKIRLRHDPNWGMFYEDFFENKWRSIYVIPKERVEAEDIALGNHFCATHPNSLFRNHLLIALPHPEGRTTLMNRAYRTVNGVEAEERTLMQLKDLRSVLLGAARLSLSEQQLQSTHEKLPIVSAET